MSVIDIMPLQDVDLGNVMSRVDVMSMDRRLPGRRHVH